MTLRECQESGLARTSGSSHGFFEHQIAGHTTFLFGGEHVYKRAIPCELSLYLTLSRANEVLRDFLPQFFGVAEKVDGNGDGVLDTMTVTLPYSKLTKSVQSLCPGSGEFPDCPKILDHLLQLLQCKTKCYPDKTLNRFLVLENLTWGYKRPCLMDIKLGVRQHGDDEPSDKIFRKQAKCDATTSKTMGLRVCGIKVYDMVAGKYNFYDKHYGRKLVETTVVDALKVFLDSGRGVRTDVVPLFIRRLKQLEAIVASQTRFFFYSSSLLFVYDADLSDVTRATVKMIDFAHTCNADEGTRDEGFLQGVGNLLALYSEVLDSEPTPEAVNEHCREMHRRLSAEEEAAAAAAAPSPTAPTAAAEVASGPAAVSAA
mmetsp:Transcript_21254/g.49932  ORF Transcript_21254/g.49932 Transcript_21254/m.49932 type:complete len:372 (-) Transcript_21254:698-1813(-)